MRGMRGGRRKGVVAGDEGVRLREGDEGGGGGRLVGLGGLGRLRGLRGGRKF